MEKLIAFVPGARVGGTICEKHVERVGFGINLNHFLS